LALLLEPFFNMSSLTPQSSTYKRIHSEIFEPLFSSLAPESEKGEDDSEDERPAKRARRSEEAPAHITQNACMEDSSKEKKMSQGELRRRLFKKLLSIASSEQTRDSNRRKLYAFWKEAGIDDDDDE
jgi:ribosomal RNA-processing protein 1